MGINLTASEAHRVCRPLEEQTAEALKKTDRSRYLRDWGHSPETIRDLFHREIYPAIDAALESERRK